MSEPVDPVAADVKKLEADVKAEKAPRAGMAITSKPAATAVLPENDERVKALVAAGLSLDEARNAISIVHNMW
jgi:hypothetical protein